MSYTKKIWQARIGAGLNKFSIDGGDPVALVNVPDTVTQSGDAFSVENMNGLENRIAESFNSVDIGLSALSTSLAGLKASDIAVTPSATFGNATNMQAVIDYIAGVFEGTKVINKLISKVLDTVEGKL